MTAHMGGGNLFARLEEASRRKVVLFIRQSSDAQVRDHRGSGEVQRDQMRYLAPFGIGEEMVTVIDARGESGRQGAHRRKFQELEAMVRRNEVGLVVLARHDRLGRNDEDSIRIFDAMAETGCLVMVDGKLFDPSEPADELMLGIYAKFAQYENAARTRWMASSRLALAKSKAFRVRLSSEFVWASPEDPVFVRRLQESGLGEHLDKVAEHKARSKIGDMAYHVLPYPNEQVWRSAVLRMRWMLETRDPQEVLKRIASHPDYPKPGLIPRLPGRRFDPDVQPRWIKATSGNLYAWFHRPALYGMYESTSWSLSRHTKKALRQGIETIESELVIQVEDAFPAIGTALDRQRVSKVYRHSPRAWKQGAYDGPRIHALNEVRCGHRKPNGDVCRLRLNAVYDARVGGHLYNAVGCFENHGFTVSAHRAIDDVVLDILKDVFRPNALRESIERVRLNERDQFRRRRDAEAELEHAERRLRVAQEAEIEARVEENLENSRHWRAVREDWSVKVRNARMVLERAREEEADLRALARTDLERIVTLGADLPSLIEHIRKSPGKLPALVAELVDVVYVRRLGRGFFEVKVVFPTGATATRVISVGYFRVTQPAQIWVVNRFAAGADAATIGAELDSMAVPDRKYGRWEVDRVYAARTSFRFGEVSPPRDGVHKTCSEIALELGVPVQDVLKAGVRGQLGPARWERDTLAFAPTESEYEHALSSHAFRSVALTMGWPESDTVRLGALRRETGRSVYELKSAAAMGSGLARDRNGKLYMRRSEARLEPMVCGATELRRSAVATDPSYAKLDDRYWIPLQEAQKRLPGVLYRTLVKVAPAIRPRVGYMGQRSVFIWLSPGIESRLRHRSVEEAVAELGRPELSACDFVPLTEIGRTLRERFGYPADETIGEAARKGRVPSLKARPTPERRPAVHVHVPAAVRSATDVQTVQAWLSGRGAHG